MFTAPVIISLVNVNKMVAENLEKNALAASAIKEKCLIFLINSLPPTPLCYTLNTSVNITILDVCF